MDDNEALANAFFFLYICLPDDASLRMNKTIPPKQLIQEILDCESAKYELKELAKSWLEEEFEENSPLKTVPRVSNPEMEEIADKNVWKNFSPIKLTKVVDYDAVQASAKATIVGSTLVNLMENLPYYLCGCVPPENLYVTLKYPETEPNFNFAAKWLFACIRENLICPAFGTVEHFMTVVKRLLEEGRGMARLVSCSLTRERACRIVPDDKDFHEMVDLLYALETGDDNLEVNIRQFIFDNGLITYREPDTPWTRDQEREANNFARQYGPSPPDSP